MNASHARPLAAFCLLTAVAAVITVAGLQADQAPSRTPVASPAPVSSSAAPDVALGGLLHGRSGLALRHPLSPELWTPDLAVTPSAGSVEVAAPTRPAATHKARTKSAGAHQASTTHGKASVSSTATATPTSSAGPAKGRGKGKADHPVSATPPATPTPTPTDPGKGVGKGKPDKPGD